MKRLSLLIALVVILASGASFGVARWVTARRVPAVSIHDPAWLKRELKLTDAQSADVEKLQADFVKQLDAACATHCSARMALGDELAKSPVDAAKARACVDKMNAVQAEAEQATLDHILKVRALLNDQQSQRYSTLIRQQVCSMPMGAY